MACFSDKTKDRCAMFVGIVSVLTFCLGLATAGYGYVKFGGGAGLLESKNMDDIKSNAKFEISGSLGYLALFAGVICAVVGILGCATAKFKTFLLALPFMILSMIVGLVLIIGAVIAGSQSGMIKDQACETIIENSSPPQTTGEFVSAQYNVLVDRFMCSDLCPCPETAKA